MAVDTEALRRWYLDAMARRIDELRELRARLIEGDKASFDAARRVAQALRGSGGTFGFPQLTAVAELVEMAPDSDTLRRVEGLIEHLHGVRRGAQEPARVRVEWLARSAGVPAREDFPDLVDAWRTLSAASHLGEGGLAERVATVFGVGVADLSKPARSALRLVPEALMRGAPVLPLAEDGETVTVATADPTSLVVELELTRLTGRRALFVVAPPEEITRALEALLDRAPAEAGARRRTVVAPDQRVASGEGKVLIVDDDPASRLLARVVLEKNGHAVVEAANGMEALDRLRGEAAVGLVVADLNMPVLDGLELLWEMRDAAKWSHIPVIVLTGETDELLESKLIEEGADDYLSKPIDPRLFAARVVATIRRVGDAP
jgi:CheY-like chemotaxis protein/HPt (histidine-containing phosphotransfer) domain-containing protein